MAGLRILVQRWINMNLNGAVSGRLQAREQSFPRFGPTLVPVISTLGRRMGCFIL
jgi:hypothetical protein